MAQHFWILNYPLFYSRRGKNIRYFIIPKKLTIFQGLLLLMNLLCLLPKVSRGCAEF